MYSGDVTNVPQNLCCAGVGLMRRSAVAASTAAEAASTHGAQAVPYLARKLQEAAASNSPLLHQRWAACLCIVMQSRACACMLRHAACVVSFSFLALDGGELTGVHAQSSGSGGSGRAGQQAASSLTKARPCPSAAAWQLLRSWPGAASPAGRRGLGRPQRAQRAELPRRLDRHGCRQS